MSRVPAPLLAPRCKASHLLFSLHIPFSPGRCQERRSSLLFTTWSCCGQWSCDSSKKRCQLAMRLDSLLRVASLPLLQAWDPELEQRISSIFHGQYLRLAHRRRTILPHPAQTFVKKTSDFPFSFLFLFLITLSYFCISFCFHKLFLKHLPSWVHQ